jgi:hypothetical protein
VLNSDDVAFRVWILDWVWEIVSSLLFNNWI